MTDQQKTGFSASSSISSLVTFDAVIFDLDGTLVDTEVLCNEAGVAACAALGHPVGLDLFQTLAGIDDNRRAELIARESGRPLDRTAFFAEWDRLCEIRFDAGIPLKPGVPDVFERIHQRGLPMAICTSSRRIMAAAKIRGAGLDSFFQAVITVEDALSPKPHPSPYLVAAEALGAQPGRCLAFEDSETGARSARAAGMTVIQVPDQHATTGVHANLVSATIAEGLAAYGF